MANDKIGRREEHWSEKEHADRVETVRALDNMTKQIQSANEQQTAQENKKNTREWTLIIVTGAVVATAILQWWIFKRQLEIGNAAAISFTGMTLENFGGVGPSGDAYWFFIPHIENSGNTATQNLILAMYFDLAEGMPKDDHAWDRSQRNFTTIQNTSIGPHVSIPGYSVQVNGVFLSQMAANLSSAYFMGDATYNEFSVRITSRNGASRQLFLFVIIATVPPGSYSLVPRNVRLITALMRNVINTFTKRGN